MNKTVKGKLSLILVMLICINSFGSLGLNPVKAEAAQAQQYTVTASEDSFVRKTNGTPSSTNPDYSNMINGGDGSAQTAYLTVKENTTSPREAYIKFNLNDYPENITSARLYLYGKNNETESTVTGRVYGLDSVNCDSWSEGTLTWNTKPVLSSSAIGTLTFNGKSSPSWQSIDVTNYLQSQLTGDKLVTFALAGGNNSIRVESKDTYVLDTTGSKAKPYLVINGTPALKTVSMAASKSILAVGQTANLSVTGKLDTNTTVDLSSASITYSSDSSYVVIDDPSAGVARAVSGGTANITASVTLDGVTKTTAIPLTVDAIPPAEITNISSGLVNGDYSLTWSDPADADMASVSVYNNTELLGVAAKGVQSLRITGLNAGQAYVLTLKTADTAGNLSSGINYPIIYEAANVLNKVKLSASKDVINPGQSLTLTATGKMTDESDADLSQATISYTSSGGCIVFDDSHSSVARAVYAGVANIKAAVTLNGVTRESEPVMIRVFPTAQDAYDTLRIKYDIKLTGYDPDNKYDLNDSDINSYISKLDEAVKGYWSTMNKSTYTWADLTSTTKSVELATASSRLRAMALQWAMYGSIYYQNDDLLHDIVEGWNTFYNLRYNENKTMYDNWFDWMVNVPNNINDSMVAIYDAVPYSSHPDLIINLNKAIDKFVPSISRTGANRVYISKVLMLRGITGKNSAKIKEGSDGLTQVFPYVTSGDGFYEDGSFIQHDYFPYAGGYGKALLHDISEALWLVSGSDWDNKDPQKVNIFDWYFDAFEPNMFKGQMINAVSGREISKDYNYMGYTAVSALLIQVELTGNPYLEREKSAIKYHLENGSVSSFLSTSSIWYKQRARKILNDTNTNTYIPPQGNFNFYHQDNVVQRGGNWLYSLKMHSDRIANYETVSNENLKGWYESDGMTQLYLDPFDFLSLFWTTVDPSRLPGITVDRDVNRPAANSANRPTIDVTKYAGDGELMANSWTGGVSMDNQYGTAGMDFKQHNYSDMDVSAKKSWFMFDDEIVALGAGINSSSDRNIETVVENRTLDSKGDNVLTVDGMVNNTPMGQQTELKDTRWIHLDGTGGYVFPSGSDINMLREEREGKSQDIDDKFYIPGNDEFNKTTMSTFWGLMREDKTHYTLTGTKLNITTQQGSLLNGTNSTQNLLQTNTPKEDFYITTALDFTPAQQGQEAGILIRLDDDSYVSVSKGISSQGSRIIAVNEINGVSQVLDFPNTAQGSVYFKIDKSGDQYSLYASDNDTAWGSALCTFTNPMAGTNRMNSGLKMGLYAQNGTESLPEITAGFDYFHIWHTRNYMTLWVDHGVKPNDAEYSYIQLPMKSSSEVASYSENPDVTILSNTKAVQAAKETKLGITGMNFWERGVLGDVKAENPSSVMMKETSGQLQLAVSDPTQKQSKISFEIKKKGTGVISKDSSVTVLQLYPTIKFEVDTTVDPGKTHNVIFSYNTGAAVLDFTAPVLESASFDSAFIVTQVGNTAAPALTAKMDDNGTADLSTAAVTYYSSNDFIATVDSTGTITGINPGTADIYAVVSLNGISKKASLQVLVPTSDPAVSNIIASKDTYTRSGIYENDEYGSETKLNVKNAGGDDYREAYFNFDLSGIKGDIESVTLYFTGKVDDSTGTFVDCVIKPIIGDFDEATTNYSNKPELASAITNATRFTNVEAEKSFDITDYIREHMKVDTSLNLALVQDVKVGRKIYVYSSENTSKQPYIAVKYHNFGNAVHDSVISPASAEFDKNTSGTGYKDISVTVTPNGNSLNSIMNGTVALTEGADYTVVGNVYKIRKEYLVSQPTGQLLLNFDFGAGADPQLNIHIGNTTQVPSADATLSSLELSGITLSPAFSSEITSYNASVDNSVTSTYITAAAFDSGAVINAEGLGLKELSVGENILTIHITAAGGAETYYTVRITRAAPIMDSTINPATTAFDKKAGGQADIDIIMNLNGNLLKAIYNGSNLLQQGIDYSVSGNKVTLKKEYIANQPVGDTNLIFRFSTGNDQTFVINVSDSSNNSGSDSSEGSNSDNTENSGRDEITIINKDDGVAQAVIEEGMLQKFMEQSVIDSETGLKKIAIDIPESQGAKTYEILLPAAAVTAGDEKIFEVGIKTEIAALTLPSNMLKLTDIYGQASKVALTVGAADKASISAKTKAAIGDHPVIELNIKVDGKNISWNNPEAPVRITIPYKPTTQELKAPEHILVNYIDGDGNIIPVSNARYNADTEEVTFTTAHFGQYAISYVEKSFEDIAAYSWAKKEIEVLASRGIINGTGEKTFDPGDNITRADFIVLLIKTLGLSVKVEGNFIDVKPDDYYYEALGIAKKLGIADGVGDNIFIPESKISRQDMMVITARALRKIKKLNTAGTRTDLEAFYDRDLISTYAVEDLSAMVKSGLIKGNDDIINPLGNTTRAEAAVLMYRIFNK